MQLGFSKGEQHYGCSRSYSAKEQPSSYEFEINGEIIKGVYTPYAGGGGMYIPNKWKVSDSVWLRIGALKDAVNGSNEDLFL